MASWRVVQSGGGVCYNSQRVATTLRAPKLHNCHSLQIVMAQHPGLRSRRGRSPASRQQTAHALQMLQNAAAGAPTAPTSVRQPHQAPRHAPWHAARLGPQVAAGHGARRPGPPADAAALGDMPMPKMPRPGGRNAKTRIHTQPAAPPASAAAVPGAQGAPLSMASSRPPRGAAPHCAGPTTAPHPLQCAA